MYYDFFVLNEPNNLKKYSKKIIKPTSEELLKHEKFLKSEIKKNYFN